MAFGRKGCAGAMNYHTVLAALVLLVAACAKRPAPGPVTASEPPEVAIQVENQFAGSLSIYLDVSGVSRRLGQVNMQDTRSFVVPWRAVGEGIFSLRGEVIGSGERVVTQEVRIQPGQIVRWTLAASLRMSSVMLH